jgi:hypothetical protein
MKRKSLGKTRKHAILAIPAAALMLGASHGATIGINYTLDWGPYNPNGTYVPYHYAYMTTGMNVTGTAFGVPASSWTNIQGTYYQPVSTTNIVGSLSIISMANNEWSSGLGNTNTPAYGTAPYLPAIVAPGNDEVTWSYLDDNVQHNGKYNLWSVQISGLKTAYPNGYTVQTVGFPVIFPAPNANVSDLATFTNALVYTDLGPRQGTFGTVDAGLSNVSPVMTNDTVTIYGDPPVGDKDNPPIHHSTLCGFIIADAASAAPLSLQISGGNIVWSSGTLQSSPTLGAGAVWTDVSGATSPYPISSSGAPKMFYRLSSTP